MNELSNQSCEACSADAKPLTSEEIELLLSEVRGWKLIIESDIKKLSRIFNTKNYTESVSFTNAVADLAESVNHHPLIIMDYSSVTVIWWSHKIKGLHKNDFIMAAKTNELFA